MKEAQDRSSWLPIGEAYLQLWAYIMVMTDDDEVHSRHRNTFRRVVQNSLHTLQYTRIQINKKNTTEFRTSSFYFKSIKNLVRVMLKALV